MITIYGNVTVVQSNKRPQPQQRVRKILLAAHNNQLKLELYVRQSLFRKRLATAKRHSVIEGMILYPYPERIILIVIATDGYRYCNAGKHRVLFVMVVLPLS